MTIRPLTVSDAPVFRELRLYALRESPTAFGWSYEEANLQPVEYFAKRLEVPGVTLGAFNGERLIGLAGLSRFDGIKERHKAWIWGVYVHPERRRGGIAQSLMQALLVEARAMEGLLRIKLTVSSDNLAAKMLYERLGFRAFGTERGSLMIDGQALDEDYMALELGDLGR